MTGAQAVEQRDAVAAAREAHRKARYTLQLVLHSKKGVRDLYFNLNYHYCLLSVTEAPHAEPCVCSVTDLNRCYVY
jgi:hypothetical protein